MVRVPVRLVEVFAATLNPTVPFPVPLVPAVIVSHAALLADVHAHPGTAVTATGVPAPPGPAMDCDVGLIEGTQGAPA